MLYDFEIDDTFIGQTIGPSDGGFLVDNKQVRRASRSFTPAADEGKGPLGERVLSNPGR
jgi:hypothetical protein